LAASAPAGIAQSEPHGDLQIAFFGHDANESTIAKRVAAFRASGAGVVGLMFRRERGNTRPAGWDNVDLGVTVDRNYLKRVPKLAAAVFRVLGARRRLAACNVFYARNVDMLALAALARAVTGSKASLAYEVLDIQRAFLGGGAKARTFRWVERQLMKRCELLVVSSPDFLSRYFRPVQKYEGPAYLLENKVASPALDFGAAMADPPVAPPWVIGWFGTLRCRRSLAILCSVADALGDRVRIHIRGRPSEEDLGRDELEAAAAARSNVTYFGAYRNPDDLAAIYGAVHFTWCVDYLDAGTNSDWLLPNRIYEGGAFASVALARQHTATGRMVEQEGLGWTLQEPLESSASEFLRRLDPLEYQRRRQDVGALPRSLFVDDIDTARLLELLGERRRERAA